MVPRYVPGAPLESAEEIAAPAKEEFPLFAPSETVEQPEALVEPSTPEVSVPSPVVTPAALAQQTVAESGLPAWLREDFREMAEAAQPTPAPKPMVKPTIGLRSSLPPWLAELQETLAEPPKPAPWFAPGEIEKQEPSEAVESVPPAWLTPAMPEVEAAAVVEEAAPAQPQAEVVSEEGLPDWLRAGAESARVEQPTEPRAEETPIEVAPSHGDLEPRAVEETAAPRQVKPKRKRQPRGYNQLILAREHRDANRLEDALVEYDYVVQHGPKLTDDVIGDLEPLIQRRGIPLDAHRILGDAYVRADRLADALERYHYVLDHISQPS
jgi:hypothetical protein